MKQGLAGSPALFVRPNFNMTIEREEEGDASNIKPEILTPFVAVTRTIGSEVDVERRVAMPMPRMT